jgi:hypothetical protein
MSFAVDEISIAFENLQKKYEEHLPKVDPDLIWNLLYRKRENPSDDPIFLVEVFTKPGLDTEEVRKYILQKTGRAPQTYDNGTHYVTNQKLNLRMLKEMSDSDDVLEIKGEYTERIGAFGPSHEHRENAQVGRQTAGRGKPPG